MCLVTIDRHFSCFQFGASKVFKRSIGIFYCLENGWVRERPGRERIVSRAVAVNLRRCISLDFMLSI